MNSNKIKMVEYEKFTNKYIPNNHIEKSIYFPVTIEVVSSYLKLFSYFTCVIRVNFEGSLI